MDARLLISILSRARSISSEGMSNANMGSVCNRRVETSEDTQQQRRMSSLASSHRPHHILGHVQDNPGHADTFLGPWVLRSAACQPRPVRAFKSRIPVTRRTHFFDTTLKASGPGSCAPVLFAKQPFWATASAAGCGPRCIQEDVLQTKADEGRKQTTQQSSFSSRSCLQVPFPHTASE